MNSDALQKFANDLANQIRPALVSANLSHVAAVVRADDGTVYVTSAEMADVKAARRVVAEVAAKVRRVATAKNGGVPFWFLDCGKVRGGVTFERSDDERRAGLRGLGGVAIV